MEDILFMVGALFIVGAVVAGIIWLFAASGGKPPEQGPEADGDDREADI